MYYGVMVAMVCYCIAVQTIDGKSNGPLHTPSAGIFFIIFQLSIVHTTYFLYQFKQYDSRIISQWSLIFKMILTAYITLVWVFCLYKILSTGQDIENIMVGKTDFTVVLEWNAFLINLLWIVSYLPEWRKISITLEGTK